MRYIKKTMWEITQSYLLLLTLSDFHYSLHCSSLNKYLSRYLCSMTFWWFTNVNNMLHVTFRKKRLFLFYYRFLMKSHCQYYLNSVTRLRLTWWINECIRVCCDACLDKWKIYVPYKENKSGVKPCKKRERSGCIFMFLLWIEKVIVWMHLAFNLYFKD